MLTRRRPGSHTGSRPGSRPGRRTGRRARCHPGRRAAAALAALGCAVALALLPSAASADAIRADQQWVLSMMHVPDAWQQTRGGNVTVAVIDSGVYPGSSDLAGSVESPGVDYSGVGTKSSNASWGVHGTWMASLIAGHGHGPGDDSGVLGIAPQAAIMSIRVIPDRTDPNYPRYGREQEPAIQQSLASGIQYAVQHGAQVISMSIGYSAPNAGVRQALQDAYDHGVVVVASAGNSGAPSGTDDAAQAAPESFPADYPGVISVGAVDSAGTVAAFSSDNLSVQVAAPGVSVPAQGRDGQYWWVSGTSPACALVAGVAALIKSKYPTLAPRQVASALAYHTTDPPSGGYDNQVGFGIVNAAAALARAGQLTGHQPAPASVAVTTQFGGGPGAVAASPVRPRGSGPLILFALLAVTSLVLAAAAVSRLATLRRSGR